MSKHSTGAFGSRKGIKHRPVSVQSNTLKFDNNPAPWFADFDRLHAEAVALTTTPAMVLPFVQNGELLNKVNATAVNADVQALVQHVGAMKGRLALLKSTTDDLRDRVTAINVEVIPELLNHAEAFQIFMNDWTRIVLFAQDSVLEHFRAIGEDIPYVCPFHPGFIKVATPNQMSASQFEAAMDPTVEQVFEGK